MKNTLKLIYATTNGAKLSSMRRMLAGLPLDITGLRDLEAALPRVDETGAAPLDNAVIKAKAYYAVLKQPLFSCDSGLWIEGLPDNLQPGIHVRNVQGKYLDDEQMIAYYSGLARDLGGKAAAQYINAVCLILNEREIFTLGGDEISHKKFIISGTPHKKRRAGFPLDSLSVHIATGNYYLDLESQDEQTLKNEKGFRNFFTRALKL